MDQSLPNPIRRLLVANRGEIATRILSSARELGIETFALYTDNDVCHTYNAAHAIRLSSPAAYMNVDELVSVVKNHGIDAVHPGYGFLSESAELASTMANVNVLVVGPGSENLSRTGDKLEARRLAEQCKVPVLPALTTPTGNVSDVETFASRNGLPIMVKAVDGGGGRGIRLIHRKEDLQNLAKRAIEESPSKQVFAEKAAVNNYRHVEVQIIGDGQGGVLHLWERECSIQRRYQKIVELAPSTAPDRKLVAPVIEAAVRMAKHVRYASLGTFEFLLHPQTGEFFFLEINPRLQVEHTITESICDIDIVTAQLLLAQGATLAHACLTTHGLQHQDPLTPPSQRSIQLRITAEDPSKDYSLSIGKITSFHFPSGNGVRVDTALTSSAPAVVTSDFDSVVAKLIITANTWEACVRKAQRALQDTAITGITTNLALLRAIVAHSDFAKGQCDTRWLESKHEELLEASLAFAREERGKDPLHGLVKQQASSAGSAAAVGGGSGGGSMLFRKDDAWEIALTPQNMDKEQSEQQKHHLQLTRIQRNDFPDLFSADILFTLPGHSQPQAFKADIRATSNSASSTSSQHRKGNRADASHVVLPVSGKLVEVCVDVGDWVEKDEAVCVVKQMKMELEIRSHRAGRVGWVTEAEDEEDVAEGMLVIVVDDEEKGKERGERARL